MSFFTNQTMQSNGSAITGFEPVTKKEANLLMASQGYQDSSTLSSFIDLDPMRNMLLLENAWDKKVMNRQSFADSIYRDAIGSNAIIEVNGLEGSFRYKMSIETDNCMKTVEDTSKQSADGYVGSDGTSFKIVLNKQLSPFTAISCDMAFGDVIIIDDQDVVNLGYGFEHWAKLVGSEKDRTKAYPTTLLHNDVTYKQVSGSYIAEYSEKLAKVHLPGATNYLECEFKLGSGQGFETWVTGKADSMKLMPGYVTADTTKYLQEIAGMGMDADRDVIFTLLNSGNGNIATVAKLMEMLAIKNFNEKFNTSLMFMVGDKISTSKGSLEFNEGFWRQLLRGKRVFYSRRGNATLADIATVRNYVHKYNNSRVEDTFLRMKAGSELYDNLERIIQQNAMQQITNLAPLMGQDRVVERRFVTGELNNLSVELVRFNSAHLPGIGKFEAVRDTTLDYLSGTDVRRRGINPAGKDHTTYTGIVWDVTDQFYSNNAKLPEGTMAVGGEKTARQNVYLVRPERNAVVWGHENGRYNSQKSSDIIASSKTMHESFFIYGFGAMWLVDPSKFVMLELKERYSSIV